jgi:hypothetical protein
METVEVNIVKAERSERTYTGRCGENAKETVYILHFDDGGKVTIPVYLPPRYEYKG